MHKGITPTITLTLPETVDLSYSNNVYVTFVSGRKKITKTGGDLVIDKNVIEVFLQQEETLSFTGGTVNIQVNWTYRDGDTVKRAASDIASVVFESNLETGVLE